MKFNILGSGGVYAPPKPGCNCRICDEAREKGIPFARTGTCLYSYDSKTLFDLPEEIRLQLTRENIVDIENVVLTHWHPDHTLGIRVLEQLNFNPILHKPNRKPINVYISQFQYDMLKKYSCGGFLDFYEKVKGIINVKILEAGEVLELEKVSITPRLIEHTNGFYYEITDSKSKLVYAPCEYHKLQVNLKTTDVDTFVAHHLWFENKTIGNPDINWSDEEDSFEQMLLHSKQMGASNIVVTHIEEVFGLNHFELNDIVKEKYPEFNIEFAFDGMCIEL